MKIDKLEHGWIVDGVGKGDEEIIIHCHCCWKVINDDDYESKGFGKYICKNCLMEEIDG